MRLFIRAAMLALACASTAPVLAASASEALGNCLVDKSTGSDRKVLARWIFVSMSAHPALGDIFSVSHDTHETSNKAAADIFTRLVTVDCKAESRAARDQDSAGAFKVAFAKLGEVAMGELLSNPGVQAEFEGLGRYADREALRKAFDKP